MQIVKNLLDKIFKKEIKKHRTAGFVILTWEFCEQLL